MVAEVGELEWQAPTLAWILTIPHGMSAALFVFVTASRAGTGQCVGIPNGLRNLGQRGDSLHLLLTMRFSDTVVQSDKQNQIVHCSARVRR
jgi:hypothetical protein